MTEPFASVAFVAGVALILFGMFVAERDDTLSITAILVGSITLIIAIWIFAS
jgi:hypothetical protein